MKKNKMQEDSEIKNNLTSELYDKYAPPVYRKILSVVQQDPIAERIHEKVFLSAYTNNSTFPLRSPLMSLIDIANEKSSKTIKALEIFRACCSGASVSKAEKK